LNLGTGPGIVFKERQFLTTCALNLPLHFAGNVFFTTKHEGTEQLMQRFRDRHDAGRQLAIRLLKFSGLPNVIVLALPRGGVPVAYEIVQSIKAPLDLLIVRKLGLPGEEELAIGAIASGGIRILNEDVIQVMGVDQSTIDRVIERETAELQRRERQYRGDRPAPDLRDRAVILVDDGLATGASMLAAVRAVRTRNPAQIVVAIPTASTQAIYLLRQEVDEVLFVMAPEPFEGVGKWYGDFTQTTDQEVKLLLEVGNQSILNK
jgi:putative phosphoribosyl transferase